MDGIVDLLTLVFRHRFTRDWWRWKYELNPNGFWGERGDIWVAEKEGKIVGHYAVIPEGIKFRSRMIKVAQSVDTATHPSCRRMGIFSTLASRVYSDARHRYPFIYGFPTQMAYSGFLSLGWKHFSVPEYVKILNFDLLKRVFTGVPLATGRALLGGLFLRSIDYLAHFRRLLSFGKLRGRGVEIEEIKTFSSEIDDFWQLVSRDFKVVIQRTHEFLNWRFSKHFGDYRIFLGRSLMENEILGYVIVRKRTDGGRARALDIVDLMTMRDETRAASRLIDTALKVGRKGNIDTVRCWLPSWHEDVGLLTGSGFFPMDMVDQLTETARTRLILYDLQSQGLPSLREWFYTMADTDFA